MKLVSEIQFPNENIAYFSNLNNDNIEQSAPEQKYLIKNKVEKISTLISIEITEYNIVDEIYKTWEKLGGFLTFICSFSCFITMDDKKNKKFKA